MSPLPFPALFGKYVDNSCRTTTYVVLLHDCLSLVTICYSDLLSTLCLAHFPQEGLSLNFFFFWILLVNGPTRLSYRSLGS